VDTVVEAAIKKAEKAHEYWADIYNKAKEDLLFLSDAPDAQWDEKAYSSRVKSGRPTLTIDQLSQFVNQVSNDIRMNTPSINVIAGDQGDPEVAEILEGKIRAIQASSNADDAYDNAVNFAIKSSVGFIRIDHDYADAKTFDQDLFVQRVVNPSSVLFDPESIEPDGSDAKCCFILENISKESFKELYPDASPVSFSVGNIDCEDDEIIIAEYFQIEEKDAFLIMDENGDTYEAEEVPVNAVRSRSIKKPIVYRYKISGEQVLDEGVFPSDYIPIVPVYGEEAWIDGQRNILSLIRRSKDAQRMYNYWASLETEMLMKAPKAHTLAAEGTTEDYAEDWLNPDKSAVLRYKQTDSSGQLAPPPQMMPAPQPPMGIINARQSATADIRSTMGLYDSFLGQQDNAISGVAISGRQREGDRAVYHYMDNLTRSMNQVGRILLSGIMQIMKTPRVVPIIGREDENEFVGINGALVEGQERHYYLNEGNYYITVTTGANFATMRQEAADFFERVLTSQPQLMNVMGDLLFKYSDFAGAQAMAERMKKIIDPALLDGELDAQTMALQQQNKQMQQGMQMLEVQVGQLQQALQDKQAEIEIKAQSEIFDAESDKRKHQVEVAKLRLEEQRLTAEIAFKMKEMELREDEFELKAGKQITDTLMEVAEYPVDINERGVL